jgi:hypothetical protein
LVGKGNKRKRGRGYEQGSRVGANLSIQSRLKPREKKKKKKEEERRRRRGAGW